MPKYEFKVRVFRDMTVEIDANSKDAAIDLIYDMTEEMLLKIATVDLGPEIEIDGQ